ncbi:MAG TPA: 16S rRNA (adenine(1518)-N(6)/adenine(1519)-N(6))-dimethyltransferase RsmA [Gammaproteobacteria bacterium]
MTAPRARKRLGQHFLHDPAVIGKLVDTIAPGRNDPMVEIGGGRGALTRPLLERLDRLHVIEVDERMADHLEASVAGPGELVVHRADALEFDFSSLAPHPGSLRVVGNLPYNISTPLLFRLLEHRSAIDDMHLMLQKEVAQRITSPPGSKDYGRLTVMLSLWAEAEVCFDVGPGAFSPPPRVRSSVIRMRVHSKPRFAVADLDAFAGVVRLTFSMRRKTLARSLKGRLTRDQIASAGIDPGARPETLYPADFARLAAVGSEKDPG